MDPKNSRSVYRYFEPADVFVRIRVCEPSAVLASPGLDRAGYRRRVLAACMPDLEAQLGRRLEELRAGDPLLCEDLLYQLAVEVNPPLDIHTVRLEEERSARRAPAAGSPRGAEDFLERLRRRARGLGERLRTRIVGQDRAVNALVAAVEKAAVGLAQGGRPLGTFLLLGRTGTGKTELVRALAAELHGEGLDERPGLVRIDCAEYALAHEHSKLIGAPPGYVGHEDGGQLTEAILRRPESIVLFDEVEKAHPRLHNVMLSILEDGSLTDGKGRRVSFERAFVLLTSNAGAAEMQAARHRMGFERAVQIGREHLEDIAGEALTRQFSPEFLGRIDETVVFSELDLEAAREIARRQLTELARRARGARLRVAFSSSVARWVALRGFSADSGAREIRRVIRRELEPEISRFLLARRERSGLVRVRIRRDRPVLVLER